MISLSNPPALLAKIDWYSFTVPLAGPMTGCGPDVLGAINHALSEIFPATIDPIASDGTWSIDPAKGFYAYRATHRASMVAVSWGAVNAHAFVELAGQPCDWLRLTGAFSAVVAATYARVSRIDCAIDIRTTTTPETFVGAGHAKRFAESFGNIHSSTGDTYYVGNRKSDRCARVYRYAPPHPRSHLLRVEAEYKGKAARELGALLASDGELATIRSAHYPFLWASKEIDPDFLQLASCGVGRAINPVMANTAGWPRAYCPPLDDTMRTDWLTLSAGWQKWYWSWALRNALRRSYGLKR